MSEHVEDPRHRRMHNCSRNDDTFRCRSGGADTVEEIDAVSATTCASSPNESSGQPPHIASPQEPFLPEDVSQQRRRPRSASALDTFLPTPPRRAALGSGRGDQIHAGLATDLGEDTLATNVSLSSITAVGGCSGSSTALKNSCVSSPSITAAAHSNTGLTAHVFDGEMRPAEGVVEPPRHPHGQAYPQQNAVKHGDLAQQKRGPGSRVWLGIEAETPRVSPHHPPWTTPRSSDCSYTYDIAATLADLLRRYLPQGPPLSHAAEGKLLPVANAGVCTRFLTVRWGRWGREKTAAAAALPPSRPEKYRQSPTEVRSWLGGPPSPRACPPPVPPQQLSPADATHPHGLFKEHHCSSSSDRTTDVYAPHHMRPPRQHEHLWNLLTHYPRDASACLALGHGICAVLDIMREEPPPVLPTAVLRDIAASTATDINAFIHACEEAWEMASSTSVERTAAVPRHVRGVDDATCRCGCLAAGQLLDVSLYRFHLLYYLHHNRYPSPLQRQDTDDCRVAESLLRGARHDGERNALEEARAAVREQPHAQRQPQQPPRRAPPARHDGPHVAGQAPERESPHTSASPPPLGLSCVQTTSPTALLPLLALQTLSSFVGASSKRRSLAIGRRRRRWGLRAARRCGGHSSPTPLGSASTPSPRQETEKPPKGQPSPGDKSKSSNTEADHADNYLYFCDETERLWAVMASVLLAWKQLEQCVSLSVFVPRLEVLQASSSHACRSTTLSPLARAAASMRLPHCAVEEMLLHAAYDSVTASATRSFTVCDTTFERTVVARLRIRILSVVPTSRNREDTCVNDDVASSLRMMESFVYSELEGRIAQLPLWCAVAVEVLHLHIEQLRHNRALLERELERGDSAANGRAVGCEDRAAWSCLHSSRAQQVVLLATRLMALICIPTDATSAWVSAAELAVPPAAPPCRTRRWRRTAAVDNGARGASRERGDYSHPPSHDLPSADSVAATGNVSAASVAQLSAVMYQHPLFGVAVAVVGGGVPLHWAEACVAPRAMSLGPLAVVRSHPRPPVEINGCDPHDMDACSGGPSLATVAAADAEAQAELRVLVQRITNWLQEAEGRL